MYGPHNVSRGWGNAEIMVSECWRFHAMSANRAIFMANRNDGRTRASYLLIAPAVERLPTGP